MTTKEEIRSQFKTLNIYPPENILDKCLELCLNYNMEPEDFVDEWSAYTASKLGGAAPTMEHLLSMERKEFQKQQKKDISTPKKYIIARDTDANSLASSYSNGTTPKKDLPKVTTPVRGPKNDVSQQIIVDDLEPLASQLDSPSYSQSGKYSQRSDSRQVQCYYGPTTARYHKESSTHVSVKLYGEEESYLPTDLKYMYEIIGTKAKCLNSMTHWLGQSIAKKHNLDLTENSLKDYVGQMTVYGRICPDSGGKLNVQSILLEGTTEVNSGHTVNLNVNKLNRYSLFPGQVVVVQGNNINNATLVAENIFGEATLDLPLEPPVTTGSIQIVVACGPFTLQDNLLYEPLNDLIKYVTEYKPDLLILIGPFLEATHEGILNGSLTQNFDMFFENLIESIMSPLKDLDSQVVIIASQKDAHHHPVYPTPPYNIRGKYHNLKFISDPTMIDVNGLVIGATSADVLFHMGKEELFQNKHPTTQPDRMGRLTAHLLSQQSFYPLYPPAKDMCVDHELLEQHGVLECLPHILIVPSNFRHFIKTPNGCLVINPERLAKGYVAGTFARIEITPGTSTSICSRASCQVLRI